MENLFDMTGRVVWITGGSRGLGLEMAKGFAGQGADVIITSRRADACDAAVAEIDALGAGRCWALPGHVGDWESLDALVEGAFALAGKVDVLVNNAGIAPVVPTSGDITETLFDKTVGVNFKGPFRLTALAAPRMAAAGSGAVINISSMASVKPGSAYPIYAASKAALNVLTEAHALEYGPRVRVNGIMCGPFRTDIATAWADDLERVIQSGAGRIGRPDEIITTALYLASPRSSYTTGSVIRLDGCIDEYRV